MLTRRRSLALTLYALLLLPGVALHEISHWLAAKLLRVPTRGFSLWPRRRRAGTVQLGYVETAQVDPLRASVIGLAPLLAGGASLALVGVDRLGVGRLSAEIAEGGIVGAIRGFQSLLSAPDLLLWTYLVFAVSNTMLPSRSDRAAWMTALAMVAAIALAGATLGFADGVAALLGPPALGVADGLAGAFLLATGLDLALLVPLLLLEMVLTRLVGWEIVY